MPKFEFDEDAIRKIVKDAKDVCATVNNEVFTPAGFDQFVWQIVKYTVEQCGNLPVESRRDLSFPMVQDNVIKLICKNLDAE